MKIGVPGASSATGAWPLRLFVRTSVTAIALASSVPSTAKYLVSPDRETLPIAFSSSHFGKAFATESEPPRGEPQKDSQPDAPSAVPGAPATPFHQSEGEDIVVTGHTYSDKGDPLMKVNEKTFAVAQAVDKAVFEPVALAYKHGLPEPVRDGLRNFFRNLREPVIAFNFLLQLHPGKAAETLARFAINTTIGGAGIFDVASHRPFKLPRRRNGFADTLGYYGVKPGPFLFLPIFGPTTLRDLIGETLDRVLVPAAIGGPFRKPAFSIPAATLSALDRRAEIDDRLQMLREAANPYRARREQYLTRRALEIEGLHSRSKRDNK